MNFNIGTWRFKIDLGFLLAYIGFYIFFVTFVKLMNPLEIFVIWYAIFYLLSKVSGKVW